LCENLDEENEDNNAKEKRKLYLHPCLILPSSMLDTWDNLDNKARDMHVS
jgi:hypothetical protein